MPGQPMVSREGSGEEELGEKRRRKRGNGKERGVGGGGRRNGKRLPAQTPLKQKHPFSRENKPPSQDLHEWTTSAGRGSSNEGQDVPLRTHLRRAEGQKPEYIDPSLSLCHCPALPSHPGQSGFSTPTNTPSPQPVPSPPTSRLLSRSQRGGEGGRGTVLNKQRRRGKDFP